MRRAVHTAAEKTKVEEISTNVAGKDNVDNQLKIDPI